MGPDLDNRFFIFLAVGPLLVVLMVLFAIMATQAHVVEPLHMSEWCGGDSNTDDDNTTTTTTTTTTSPCVEQALDEALKCVHGSRGVVGLLTPLVLVRVSFHMVFLHVNLVGKMCGPSRIRSRLQLATWTAQLLATLIGFALLIALSAMGCRKKTEFHFGAAVGAAVATGLWAVVDGVWAFWFERVWAQHFAPEVPYVIAAPPESNLQADSSSPPPPSKPVKEAVSQDQKHIQPSLQPRVLPPELEWAGTQPFDPSVPLSAPPGSGGLTPVKGRPPTTSVDEAAALTPPKQLYVSPSQGIDSQGATRGGGGGGEEEEGGKEQPQVTTEIDDKGSNKSVTIVPLVQASGGDMEGFSSSWMSSDED